MSDDPQVTTNRLPYRLTEKSFFNSILQPAGTVLHLLPHEVTPTMLKVPVEDLLAASLKGAVCQSVASPIAGFLPLNVSGHIGAPHRVAFDRPRRLRLHSTADLSGIMLVVFGIDAKGAPVNSTGPGPNGGADIPWLESEPEFATVTGIMASGPVGNLTIDALETLEEIAQRLDAQSARRRLLWEKVPKTPDEAMEIEELLARRQALQGMPTRTPDQDEELRRLVADLPGAAVDEVTHIESSKGDPALLPLDPDETARLQALRENTMRTDAEEAEMVELASREFSHETPPAGSPLSEPERQRLQALRDSPKRTKAGETEMADLAAREHATA